MSAVLPAPALPTIANFQDMIRREIEKAVKPLLKRIETLEEENTNLRLENVKVLRHVSIIEGHLNINYTDYDDFCITDNVYEDLKEEGITPFCDQINPINEKVTEIEKIIKPDLKNRNLVSPPKDLTDIRADYLAEHITTSQLIPLGPSLAQNVETKIMKTNEFKYFIKNVLPVEFRPKNVDKLKNWSKLKSDVFKACEERHGKENIFVEEPDPDKPNQEKRLIWARQYTEQEEKELLVRMGLLPAANYPYDIKEV